jgi:hypothetical protein
MPSLGDWQFNEMEWKVMKNPRQQFEQQRVEE